MTKAILFGSIGVLAETSELQRAAFNEAFAEADLSWHWSPAEYEMMLGQNGGEQRIRTYGHVQGVSVDAARLHKRKSEIYRAKLAKGIAPRPEIDTVVRAALGMNLRLGFVTTTSRANVDTVLDALPDDLHVEIFDFVGDRDMVEHGKPARDIYDLALQKLGIDAAAADDGSRSRFSKMNVAPKEIKVSHDWPKAIMDDDNITSRSLKAEMSEDDHRWLEHHPLVVGLMELGRQHRDIFENCLDDIAMSGSGGRMEWRLSVSIPCQQIGSAP